ncbi:hypothetical protein [Metabacillus sp. FJAT-52054]|uniref:Uncharacterized protein n=1 Tax=Metabacillus sediminis TaxID=3117746 RepID=A0ABZ2NE19_9BACI
MGYREFCRAFHGEKVGGDVIEIYFLGPVLLTCSIAVYLEKKSGMATKAYQKRIFTRLLNKTSSIRVEEEIVDIPSGPSRKKGTLS